MSDAEICSTSAKEVFFALGIGFDITLKVVHTGVAFDIRSAIRYRW